MSVEGFKWKELTKNDTIVDVGAGVGAVSLVIAKANPDVNIVIQDLPGVISQAKEVQSYYHHIEATFSPGLFLAVDCGVARCHQLWTCQARR